MHTTSCCVIIVVMFSGTVFTSDVHCPTWFHYDNMTEQCECVDWTSAISCNRQEMTASIKDGYCITFDELENLLYRGGCPYGHPDNKSNRMFSELPTNIHQLNDMMCGPENRNGVLCGQCIDGYGPAVNKECSSCSKMSTANAIFLYIILANNNIFHLCCCLPYQFNGWSTAGICAILPGNSISNR